MTFATPLALLALLALLPVAGAWWYARDRSARAAAAYGGPPSLRRGTSRSRTTVRGALVAGAVTLLVVAIARPQWGDTEGALTRRGIDVIIALDVSRSMTAADVEPSRAAAAAAGLDDMLTHLRGDRVGLVTFGGSAFARSPLTLDLDAVAFLVGRAQIEGALVEPGTDFAEAIDVSLGLLDVPDRATTQAIVLLSDGENLGEGLDAALESARSEGVRIYTVAVGTEAGAPVPARTATAQQGTGDEGAVTRADRATLGRIAEETGGGTRDLPSIAGLAVEFARQQQSAFDEDSETVPVERFQWFLAGALGLIAVQWLIPEGRRVRTPLGTTVKREGAVALAGLVIVALLLAGCGGTAAFRHVSEGNEAYEAGRYEDALAAYQAAKELAPDNPIIDYNIGNTLNRLQRYEEASTASRDAARLADRLGETSNAARALYAAGNHAFALNALGDARDAYIEVLLRDPDDADARHNLEFVLNILAPPGQDPSAPGAAATPTPGPPGGNDPSATATPGASGPGQPGASPTPGSGQPDATGTPGAGQPGATATPDPGATPSGTPSQPGQTTDPAQGADSLPDLLEELLADGVSLEEALAVLDRLREESEAANIEPRAPAGGGLPDQ
ncbi:MAG: VWA domain-containing protein [Dehalococcoidia bacterium]